MASILMKTRAILCLGNSSSRAALCLRTIEEVAAINYQCRTRAVPIDGQTEDGLCIVFRSTCSAKGDAP
jgi:hypothetical protein